MNRLHLAAGPLVLAVVLPLAGCGSSSSGADHPSINASSTTVSTPKSTSTSSTASSTATSGASGTSSAANAASGTSSSSGSAASGARSSSSATATGNPSSSSAGNATASPAESAKDSSGGGASVAVPKTSAVNISIPSIGLNHGIVSGGLTNGVLSPPAGDIIQFTGYGRVIPGQPGIAVLAGHVTYSGPDVFYNLHSVAPGAAVTISYADGTSKKFVVTDKASVNKDSLQSDPRVWGASSSPVVALVTCDAASAWVNAQHHANNYVVWARPVS